VGWFKKALKKVGKVIGNFVSSVENFIDSALKKMGVTWDQLMVDLGDLLEKASGKLLPAEIDRWAVVIIYLAETAMISPTTFVKNMIAAIKAGDFLQFIDVISPAVAAAMENVRNQAYFGAARFPPQIRAAMGANVEPEAVEMLEHVRWTTIKRVDEKGFFYVWNHMNGDREAITIIDLVVFVDEPDFNDPDTVFLSLHELKHALQYRALGTETFAHEYLMEELFHSGNKFERDADYWACKILPSGNPVYIASCPLP
jgi:hypothetical protein